MGSGASGRYKPPTSPDASPASGQAAHGGSGQTRISNEVPLDETLDLIPIDALFDGVAGRPPVGFMESIKPIDALGIIPKVMQRAQTTYEHAKKAVNGPAATSAELSLENLAAILKYVAEDSSPAFYAAMNNLCYDKTHRGDLKAFVSYVWLMMHSLQKLEPYPQPKVHRGVRQNLHSQYWPGRELTWWSFVSCTKTIEVLENSMFCGKKGDRTIFSITLRQRQARDISPFSPLPEGEVLLPPGCRFRVAGRADVGNGLTIVDLEELPSTFYVLDLSVIGGSQVPAAAASSSSRSSSHAPKPIKAEASKSASFWFDLGVKGGGNVGGKQYSAKDCYEAALALNPKSAAAWHSLGTTGGGNVGGKQYSEKDCYEAALALDPKQSHAN